MTQRTTLRALDATIAGAFAAAGLADSATYYPKAGAAVADVPVLVDRGVTLAGGETQVASDQVVLTVFHADVGEARPVAGARFVIGEETFTVDRPLQGDESRAQLLCKVGR